MQKIILINPPQNTRYPQPPMGLALLGAVLEKNSYEVVVHDLNVDVRPLEMGADFLNADVVGVTSMTPTIGSAFALIRGIKKMYPKAQTVLGGIHATLLSQKVLAECPEIDCVIKGEGEKAILEVLDGQLRGVYEHNDVDIDSLPYLAYHLLPWERYRPHPPHGRMTPWLPMITSRGCPYKCSFCAGSVFGKKYRGQSPKRVVDEIEYYRKRFGVREIAFYDDVFTMDKKRAYEIAEEILKRNIKILWTCETRVNLVDKELLEILKRSGCYSISYGIESGSQKILDSLCKGITLEQVESAIAMTKNTGIETVGYFMIGSPGETPETVSQTIEFAKNLKLDYAQFSVTTPFPGTMLYNMYIDGREEIPWENYVYTGNVFPMFDSKELSRDDIKRWVKMAYKEFYLRPSYAWQRLSGVRSVGDVLVLSKGLNMLRGM